MIVRLPYIFSPSQPDYQSVFLNMYSFFPVSISLILLLFEHSASTVLPYEDFGTEPIAGELFSYDSFDDKPFESDFDLSAGDSTDPSSDIFADISNGSELDLFAGVSNDCSSNDLSFDGIESFGRVRARGEVCQKNDAMKDSNSEIGRMTKPSVISSPAKPDYVGLFCSQEKSNGNDIPVCDSGIARLNTRGLDGFYTLEDSELCEFYFV